MKLTVAIPTFNRPEKVRNTIVRLLPQLTPDVKLKVHDNCSSTIISDYLQHEIGDNILDIVEVIRYRVNIGADSNFQRCFELCDTEYIWMLGDDDRIEVDAVNSILLELDKYKDYDLIGINFNSDCNSVTRENPIIISSTEELANKLDHFGNWLFISTSVYKTSEYLKHIRHQSWGAYSMASQVVPPMIAISKNKTLVLSEKYIVTNIKAEQIDKGGKWSDFQLALSLSSLLEAPVGFKKDDFITFGKKIETWVGIYPGDSLYFILKSLNFNIDLIDKYHIYIFKQLFFRTITFRSNKTSQYIQFYQCLFLLKNKMLLKLLLKFLPKIRKKSQEKTPFYLFAR